MQPIWHAGCGLHAARVISLWTGIMWPVGIWKDALFPRVKINFKFKLPKWEKSIHVTVNYHEFLNLFTKIIISSSIAGVIGMNVMCFVLSLAAVVTWLAQFFLRLRKNVLIREDIANGGWSSEGEATVGYSFWLVFIASIGTDQLIDTADELSNRVIRTVIWRSL